MAQKKNKQSDEGGAVKEGAQAEPKKSAAQPTAQKVKKSKTPKTPSPKALEEPSGTPAKKSKPAESKPEAKAKAAKAAESQAPETTAAKAKKEKPAELGKAQIQKLSALAPSFAEPLDRRVADILFEAREMEAVLEKLGEELIEKSLLSPELVAALPERRKLVEIAEDAWSRARSSLMSDDQKALRKEAERLKRDMMAALRYFLRKAENSEEIDKRLDAIAEGTGLADLVSDLRQLSGLLDEYAEALAKADLPKKASTRALVLADALNGSASVFSASAEAQKAMDLRNRAFWWLREILDEVRAASRYVFRDHPKKLALFRPVQKRRLKAKPAQGTGNEGK